MGLSQSQDEVTFAHKEIEAQYDKVVHANSQMDRKES